MNDSKQTKKMKANIVIIGGGGAGLTAGVAAAEAGEKNIIVLEKASVLGGNADLSHGIFAVESPVQKRLGIKATRDEVFKKQMTNSHWMVDPRVVRAFINKSGEIIQWLEQKGVKFNIVIEEFLPGGDAFFHMLCKGPSGACGHSIIEALVKDCGKLGIRSFCDTAAKQILTDDKGKVNGVLARANNKEVKITAKGVIIAAGGFGANKKMLRKYLPLRGEVRIQSLPQMTGDGIVMAEKVGAFTDDHFSILLIGPGYTGGQSRSLGMLVMRPEVMLVNKNGERYSDEALFLETHNWSGNILSRQPDTKCFALIDSKTVKDIIRQRDSLSGFFKAIGEDGVWMNDLENDLKKEAAEGNIKAADSWDEIAGWMKAPPEVLKATVEQYNSFCDKGYDADFLKDKKYLQPLRTPPFYALPGGQGYDTTIGGIRINHRMEVINKKATPIKGLYAAGDNAGSWLSQNYDLTYPGSALGFALASGFIAGENAAEFVSGKI